MSRQELLQHGSERLSDEDCERLYEKLLATYHPDQQTVAEMAELPPQSRLTQLILMQALALDRPVNRPPPRAAMH